MKILDRRYLQSTESTGSGRDNEDDEVDGTVGYRRGRSDEDDDDDRDSRRRDSRRRDSEDYKRRRGDDDDDPADSRNSRHQSSSAGLPSGRSFNDRRGDGAQQSDSRRADYQDRNKGYGKDGKGRPPYGDRQPRGYPYPPQHEGFMPPMDPMMGAYGYPPHMMHPMGPPMGYAPYPPMGMGMGMGMGYPGGPIEEGVPGNAPPVPSSTGASESTHTGPGAPEGKPAPPPGPMPPKGPPGPAAAWAATGYPSSAMPSYYGGTAYDYSTAMAGAPLPPGAPSGPGAFNYNSMYGGQYGGQSMGAAYGGTGGSGAGGAGGGPPRNRDGGQRRHGGSQAPKNELPENERCTLLCTGIPKYIKEEEMMTHFKSFGRVVQLQVTASEPPAGVPAADSTSTDEKKTYNECLVQFGSWEDAKKCFSSPEAVLNNRFIRIQQSSFNIIPPADVAPATTEELAEIERIQQQKFAATKAKAAGVTLSPAASAPRPRAPRPVVPLGKPAKNKKYIAGVTPISTAKPTPEATTTPVKDGSTGALKEKEDVVDGEIKEGVENDVESADVTPSDPSSEGQPSKPIRPKPAAPAAPTKATMALQQQYDDLRKLRGQVDNIWKTKQNLLQGQIDRYHEMITLLNKTPSDKNTSTIEELESKIVDLQSQLRVIQEQRETGALQAAQQAQQSQQAADMAGGGRGGRGRGGAGFGRFGRGFAPYAGRGVGRMGGRWFPAGGRGAPPKNMSIDNRPRSLLVPASEWTQLPSTFTANVKSHFSK